MRKLWPTLLLLSLVWTYALPARGATDPNLVMPSITRDWRSLKTPHFRIHYVARQLSLAQRLAAIAERLYPRLTRSVGWRPRDATEVVLLDSADFENGFASPVPYNRTYLLLTPPADGQLVSQNDWMELVFTHEFTHLLHLDQATGFPAVMRRIFGRSTGSILPLFTFPQVFAPSWVAEGYSIHHESASGYGRGNSAIYDGIMREEVAKGPASLTAESFEGYSGSRWPFGQNYLYGSYFFEFLEDRYGPRKVRDYVFDYSRNWIPWRMDNRAYRTFHKTGKALWAEFQAWLKRRFEPQLKAIAALGAMPGRVLVDAPYINGKITPGPEGSLFYLHYDAVSSPRIRQLLPSGEIRDVRKLLGVGFLDWHPARGLLVGKMEVCNNTDVFSDLYRLDAQTGDLTRLTHCRRLLRARWSPDGEKIYAVQGGDGANALVAVDLEGRVEPLGRLAPGDVLGRFDLAPDGSGLVAGVKRLATGWNIEWYDLGSGQWRLLTGNGDTELAPRLTPDGRAVTFLSDHDGRLNLRRMTLADGRTETLSNARGYVQEYAPDGTGGLWLVEYTGHGEVIRHLPAPGTFGGGYLTTRQDPMPVATLPAAADFDPDRYRDSGDYSPWSSLRPRGWAPVLSLGTYQADLLGLQVSGQDVLGFHRWAAIPVVYFHEDVGTPGGLLYYDFYNRLLLSGSRIVDLERWDETDEEPEVYDLEDRIQLLAHYPFNRLDWTLDLGLGTAWERIERHWTGSGAQRTDDDQVTGLTLSFDNRRQYLHSTGTAEGLYLRGSAENYDLFGHSAHSGTAYVTQGTGHLNLSARNNLSLDLLYGMGSEGIRPFELDGNTDLLSELGGFTRLGRREFALRGYRSSPRLTGTSLARGTLDWRLSIARIRDGFFVPPLGLGKLWGNLFVESGSAWDKGSDPRFYTSAGLELTAEVLIGYDNLTLPLTLGWAHGFDPELGEDELYLRLGISY